MPQADLYLQEAWGFYKETAADYSSTGGGRNNAYSSPTSGESAAGNSGFGSHRTVFRPVALVGTINQFSARWQQLMHEAKSVMRELSKEGGRRPGSPQLKQGPRATDGFKSLRIYRYRGENSPNGLPWCHESIYANAAGGFGRYSISFKAGTTIDGAEGIMTDVALALVGGSYFGDFHKDIAGISILLEGGTSERGCIQMIVKHPTPNPEFQNLFSHIANAPPRACGYALISKALLKSAEPSTPGQKRKLREADSASAKEKHQSNGQAPNDSSLARAGDSMRSTGTSRDPRRSLELRSEPRTPTTEDFGASSTFGDSLSTTPPFKGSSPEGKPPRSPPPAQLPPSVAEGKKEKNKVTTKASDEKGSTPKGRSLESVTSTMASPPPKPPVKPKATSESPQETTTSTTAGGTSSGSNSPEKENVWAKKKKQQEVRDLFRVASTLQEDCIAAAKTLKEALASDNASKKKQSDNYVGPSYPEGQLEGGEGLFSQTRRQTVYPAVDHSAVSKAGVHSFDDMLTNKWKSFPDQWSSFQKDHGISSETVGSATEPGTIAEPEAACKLLLDLIAKWRFEKEMCRYICWEINRSQKLTECLAAEGVPRGAVALEERHHRESLLKMVQAGLDEIESEQREKEALSAKERANEMKKEQARKKAADEAESKAKRDAIALQIQKQKEADAKVAEEERQRKKQEKLEKKGAKQESQSENRSSTPSPEATSSSASPSATPPRHNSKSATTKSKSQTGGSLQSHSSSSAAGSLTPASPSSGHSNSKKKNKKSEKDEPGPTQADLERQHMYLKILIFGSVAGLFIAMVLAALYI